MGRSRKQRPQQHGSAWHWKQTDCWYYTPPSTRKRMPLFDEKGQRIRGKENQEAAETALAKVKVATDSDSTGTTGRPRWLVAKVCSEYLQYCERGVANNILSKGSRSDEDQLLLLYLPAHVCPPDAFRLLESWSGVFHRDVGRTDRRYAQGGRTRQRREAH